MCRELCKKNSKNWLTKLIMIKCAKIFLNRELSVVASMGGNHFPGKY